MDKRILNMNWTTGQEELSGKASSDPAVAHELATKMMHIDISWAKHWYEEGNMDFASLYLDSAYEWWAKRDAPSVQHIRTCPEIDGTEPSPIILGGEVYHLPMLIWREGECDNRKDMPF